MASSIKPPTRDNQRQRVYDAETAAFGSPSKTDVRVSKHAQRCLVIDVRGERADYPSVQAVQAYVDEVRTSAPFRRRWGHRYLRVYSNHSGTSRGGGGVLNMAPAHRDHEETILHEIAHNVAGPEHLHGPVFAATLLELVKIVMGPEHAARLRQAYAQHGVKYRAGLAAVPSPSKARLDMARSIKTTITPPPKPLTTPRAERKTRPPVVGYDASYEKGWQYRGHDSLVGEGLFKQRHPQGDTDAWVDGYFDQAAGREKWHMKRCQAGEVECGEHAW